MIPQYCKHKNRAGASLKNNTILHKNWGIILSWIGIISTNSQNVSIPVHMKLVYKQSHCYNKACLRREQGVQRPTHHCIIFPRNDLKDEFNVKYELKCPLLSQGEAIAVFLSAVRYHLLKGFHYFISYLGYKLMQCSPER